MYLTDNIIKLSNKIGQRVYTVVSEGDAANLLI